MKIAVAAMGGSLDAQVAEQFGRCRWFVVVESGTFGFEAFLNPASTMAGGAGPAAVRELTRRAVQVVLAGDFGTKAQQAIEAAGMRHGEARGKVRTAVAEWAASHA